MSWMNTSCKTELNIFPEFIKTSSPAAKLDMSSVPKLERLSLGTEYLQPLASP